VTTFWNATRLRPRTVLVTVGLTIATIGLAMNWSALVAAGVAPLLISALPCSIMCALGLCMSRMGRSSCATETAPQQSAGATPLQASSAPERIEGPQLAFDLGRPSDREAAGADQTEQQQERSPING
jgi:hypothetical protein